MIKKDWVVILIITFIVIMCWVLSDIYHARPGVEITPKLQEALEPINPTFDPQTLEKISNLKKVSEDNPSPNTTPINPSTQSARISP